MHIFQGRGPGPDGKKQPPIDITPVVHPDGLIGYWDQGWQSERWVNSAGEVIDPPKRKRGRPRKNA